MSSSGYLTGAEDWFEEAEERRPRRRAPRVTREKPEPGERVEVPYVPVRCPACGEEQPITYGRYREKGRRYHRCKEGGQEFLSVETN